ncbi:MAG: hypothetical protein RLN70_00880, partial [Rhodospirillaceae bacterium]
LAQGHRSGGIDLTQPDGLEVWNPEKLTNLEVGMKSTFRIDDVQFRFNASGFYGWYDDVQVSVTRAIQVNPAPAPKSLQVITENAATAIIKGFDVEWGMLPSEYFEIGGFVAYTDNNYTSWDSLDEQGNPLDLSSTPFSFTPKWKIGGNATIYALRDDEWGDVSLTGNVTFTDKMFNVARPLDDIIVSRTHTALNGYGPLSADGEVVFIDRNPSYVNLDLTLNWRDIYGVRGLTGALTMTNVTGNVQNDGGCYCDVALGLTAEIPQVPRMMTLKLRYDF